MSEDSYRADVDAKLRKRWGNKFRDHIRGVREVSADIAGYDGFDKALDKFLSTPISGHALGDDLDFVLACDAVYKKRDFPHQEYFLDLSVRFCDRPEILQAMARALAARVKAEKKREHECRMVAS